MGKIITVVNIKKLQYGGTSKITTKITGQTLSAMLKQLIEVRNVRQETWTLEETGASKIAYKNQLTGRVCHSDKRIGEVEMSFTLGEYDYQTKIDVSGSTTAGTSWEYAVGEVNIEKCLVGLTRDDQYIVILHADISIREIMTDEAVGSSIVGTELEPTVDGIASKYWLDISVIEAG